jgi:hypothetical protein
VVAVAVKPEAAVAAAQEPEAAVVAAAVPEPAVEPGAAATNTHLWLPADRGKVRLKAPGLRIPAEAPVPAAVLQQPGLPVAAPEEAVVVAAAVAEPLLQPGLVAGNQPVAAALQPGLSKAAAEAAHNWVTMSQ